MTKFNLEKLYQCPKYRIVNEDNGGSVKSSMKSDERFGDDRNNE